MSRTPPTRAALLLSLLAVATTGCGLVGDPPPGPLDALRTLCGQDTEVREDDPSEEEVRAARHDRDPTDDMEDLHQAYSEADGSGVTWAATGFEVVSGG